MTAFPDDCCGPIFFGRRRTVLTLVVNGHEVCLCAFDSSMAIEGIAYDAGISEPVDPPFRPKKRDETCLDTRKVSETVRSTRISTHFFCCLFPSVVGFRSEESMGLQNFCPHFLLLLNFPVVNHPFPKSCTDSPPTGRTSVLNHDFYGLI